METFGLSREKVDRLLLLLLFLVSFSVCSNSTHLIWILLRRWKKKKKTVVVVEYIEQGDTQMRRRHASLLASQGNPPCFYILVWGYIYIFNVCSRSLVCVYPPSLETFFPPRLVHSRGCTFFFYYCFPPETHTRLCRRYISNRPSQASSSLSCSIYIYDMMAYATFFSFLLDDLLAASSILNLFFFSPFTDGKLHRTRLL